MNDATSDNTPDHIKPNPYQTNWPKAYSELNMQAEFRTLDEDFQVNEVTNRELVESGPHMYLYIEKKGTNTHWLARKLANHAKIDLKDVGYAGLKDRHGVTRQWFSLPIKNKEPDLTHVFSGDEFTLLEKGFYGVKLKRGALGGNQFKLILRNVVSDRVEVEERLELIKSNGVPNYFGEQRFGHNNENLYQAEKFYKTGKRPRNRQKTSMYLSASRSYLFNQMLANRIKADTWTKAIDGEVFGFAGSLRGFRQEGTPEETERFNQREIHPTCAMWGRGESLASEKLLELEKSVAHENPIFSEGIEKQGMKQERRATRLLIPELNWEWLSDDVLELSFELASGFYATSVLRELGQITEAVRVDESARYHEIALKKAKEIESENNDIQGTQE